MTDVGQKSTGNSPEAPPDETERITLAWNWMRKNRRDLPWRQSRDPWAVLVAEVMLQQTQVSRVQSRWPTFLENYPTPQAAAQAGSAAIVTCWKGLGYNRRALALHRCATVICERHDGTLPNTLPELLALPGVGQYTARAILAFAFATPAAVVDTNVARIIARAFAGRSLTWSEVQHHADSFVNSSSDANWVWGWNQGMLDLGALVCLKRSPRCEACPIQRQCVWQRNGGLEPDPALTSAGVSGTQSRFVGSDRQGRGKLIDALREGPVAANQLDQIMGWPADTPRVERVLRSLLNDGLVTRDAHSGAFMLA